MDPILVVFRRVLILKMDEKIREMRKMLYNHAAFFKGLMSPGWGKFENRRRFFRTRDEFVNGNERKWAFKNSTNLEN